MDDVTRAMLGDREPAKRLTERGDIIPCQCGGIPTLVCFQKRGIPCGDMGYLASIKCPKCWAEMRRWALKKKWAIESAKKGWNTRAPLLTAAQMESLERMEGME